MSRFDTPVRVPDLIGGTVDAARTACLPWKLALSAVDDDGVPLEGLPWTGNHGELPWPDHYIVRWQAPPGGDTALPGDVILIRASSGGGSSGDREPRRPLPDPLEDVADVGRDRRGEGESSRKKRGKDRKGSGAPTKEPDFDPVGGPGVN